jgi:alkylation response protein AidB-like acyl-CoA dehydrogenase
MDLAFGPELAAFRVEVEAFLAEAWPAARRGVPVDAEARRGFLDAAVARGYLYRQIPRRWGGSEERFDPFREAIVADLFDAARAPWRLGPQGIGMIVPTLLEVGAEWQRERFIRPTLRGDLVWCQGYSEPGAGSDLASLRSSARLEGDHWVIDGHKIWTSDADHADLMFGLFRTEPEARRHAGISYLLLEMRQPGVEVRPLRQINGETHFHEVFLSGARTPADWIVGERGRGWEVTRVNLRHERNLGGGQRMRGRFEALVALARERRRGGRPALEDPVVRDRLAELLGYVRCSETMTLRQLSAAAHGEGAEVALAALVNKLYGTELGERVAQLGYDLLGADGLRAPTGSSWGQVTGGGAAIDWVDAFLFELASRIAAGSSNIQRNVIGERGLGLPRDLRRGGSA